LEPDAPLFRESANGGSTKAFARICPNDRKKLRHDHSPKDVNRIERPDRALSPRRGRCPGHKPSQARLYMAEAIAIRAAVWHIGVSQLAVEQIEGGYKPAEDEAFMNERQRDYFRRKLIAWKDDILKESQETLVVLQSENENHPDLADRASFETDRSIELRARDRQRKLISKIDAALARLDDGTYGYCEETGEPISLKRLDARPIATLSVEAQERHERRERTYRET
jgi:DnaK suppressor protein